MNSSTFIHFDRMCNMCSRCVVFVFIVSFGSFVFFVAACMVSYMRMCMYVLVHIMCVVFLLLSRYDKKNCGNMLGMFDWFERTAHIPGAHSVNGMTSVGMFCNDMRFIVCWNRNLLKIIYI